MNFHSAVTLHESFTLKKGHVKKFISPICKANSQHKTIQHFAKARIN